MSAAESEVARLVRERIQEPLLDDLRQSCGAQTRGDDPGFVWIRFPLEAWANLEAASFGEPVDDEPEEDEEAMRPIPIAHPFPTTITAYQAGCEACGMVGTTAHFLEEDALAEARLHECPESME